MSVSSDYFLPGFRFGSARSRSTAQLVGTNEKDTTCTRLERARWIQVGLGAIALGLYTLLTATSDAVWPVLIGPFVLLGIARLMGLRSLWK